LGRTTFACVELGKTKILTIFMAKILSLGRESTRTLHVRKAVLLRQLSVPPQLIRASVVERYGTCGHRGCRCYRGQKHGPYHYLTQCLASARIRKFLLRSQAQVQAALAATTSFSRFYDALEELSQINTELLRRGKL
jgi:hypothetical protein